MKPDEKSDRGRTMGNGFKLHPFLLEPSCSSHKLCSRSLPWEAGTLQLAVPHPLQHRVVCETVSPRHHVPAVWKELYLNRCCRNVREGG